MSNVGTCPHCGAWAVLLSGHDICRVCFDHDIPGLVCDYSQVAWAAVAFVNDPYGFTGQDYDTPSTRNVLWDAVRAFEKRVVGQGVQVKACDHLMPETLKGIEGRLKDEVVAAARLAASAHIRDHDHNPPEMQRLIDAIFALAKVSEAHQRVEHLEAEWGYCRES